MLLDVEEAYIMSRSSWIMPTDAWFLRVARSQRAEPLQLMPSAVIDRVYERMSTATLNLLDSILVSSAALVIGRVTQIRLLCGRCESLTTDALL